MATQILDIINADSKNDGCNVLNDVINILKPKGKIKRDIIIQYYKQKGIDISFLEKIYSTKNYIKTSETRTLTSLLETYGNNLPSHIAIKHLFMIGIIQKNNDTFGNILITEFGKKFAKYNNSTSDIEFFISTFPELYEMLLLSSLSEENNGKIATGKQINEEVIKPQSTRTNKRV